MINLSDLKISNVEAFLFSFRQTWDLHLETREETVAESEREGGGGEHDGGDGHGGRNRVEFWDKPLIPGSARRSWSSLVRSPGQ